jgi:hypothetical protein
MQALHLAQLLFTCGPHVLTGTANASFAQLLFTCGSHVLTGTANASLAQLQAKVFPHAQLGSLSTQRRPEQHHQLRTLLKSMGPHTRGGQIKRPTGECVCLCVCVCAFVFA